MVNEPSCACTCHIVCYGCFCATKHRRRTVSEDDRAVPRWLASRFTIRRQLTPRDVEHRRRMHAHLTAQA